MSAEQLLNFMEVGSMTICGHVLTTEDVVVKRQFSGDAKKYEASVSEDGKLIVAIDTTIDESVYEELRARLIVSFIQRGRKSSGLVIQDVIEVFYEEQEGDALKSALGAHALATVKRLKTFPLPLSLMPSGAIIKHEEVIQDGDLAKKPVRLVLALPCVSVNQDEVAKLLSDPSLAPHYAMYLQSMDLNRLLSSPSCPVKIGETTVTLLRGVHYFATATEMLKASPELQAKYGIVPVEDA
jgi:hypothetical protein